MFSSKVDMLSGSVVKGLISMTVPVMIMNVMQTLFSVIDMTVLGNLVNDAAVGAVGACGMLISLCTGLLIGISTGANVVVARRIGEGDSERTEKAIGTSLMFALAGGFAMLLIGVCFAETFLRWTNCPDELLDDAVLYFKIYFYGCPVIMLYNFCASILRAMGDTKRPMYFMIIGGIAKIILNLCCITIFHMSVDGVALTTILSNLIAGGLAFFVLVRSRDKFHFNIKKMRFNLSELKEILFIGVPTGFQSALYSFANVLITAVVNSFGVDATTGISIANQFDGILYQISCATAFAATPYIAQNIGAGNIKRAKEATLKSIIITVAFGATFGALSAIFSPQLSGTMSQNPEVIKYSCQKMMLISSTYFICGINEVMGGTLRAMRKPIIPTVATLVFMCLFRFVWVYLIFPLCPNLTFLYLVWPVGWILSIIMILIAYFPTMSKLEKGACKNEEAVQI